MDYRFFRQICRAYAGIDRNADPATGDGPISRRTGVMMVELLLNSLAPSANPKRSLQSPFILPRMNLRLGRAGILFR